jgi:hypothetical protein
VSINTEIYIFTGSNEYHRFKKFINSLILPPVPPFLSPNAKKKTPHPILLNPPHSNPHPPRTSRRQRQLRHPLTPIPILEPEFLQQPNNRITRLGQRKLLTDTDAGSTVEREVSPSGPQVLSRGPAFGAEELGVGAVDIGAAVHGVRGVGDDAAAGDEEGGGA